MKPADEDNEKLTFPVRDQIPVFGQQNRQNGAQSIEGAVDFSGEQSANDEFVHVIQEIGQIDSRVLGRALEHVEDRVEHNANDGQPHAVIEKPQDAEQRIGTSDKTSQRFVVVKQLPQMRGKQIAAIQFQLIRHIFIVI